MSGLVRRWCVRVCHADVLAGCSWIAMSGYGHHAAPRRVDRAVLHPGRGAEVVDHADRGSVQHVRVRQLHCKHQGMTVISSLFMCAVLSVVARCACTMRCRLFNFVERVMRVDFIDPMLRSVSALRECDECMCGFTSAAAPRLLWMRSTSTRRTPSRSTKPFWRP